VYTRRRIPARSGVGPFACRPHSKLSIMPLVRIDLRRGKSASYRRALAAGVHQALVDIVGIPLDDCFQTITEHDADGLIYDPHYLGVERTDDVVFVQITFRRGRTPETRQALYRRIVENLARDPGVRPEDVLIMLVENDPVDWSVGNGEAQLLRVLPAQLPTGPIEAVSQR
jgi:phenylpyruvate tautomerase PptA (4-oxalocrotonate tautomerase family)